EAGNRDPRLRPRRVARSADRGPERNALRRELLLELPFRGDVEVVLALLTHGVVRRDREDRRDRRKRPGAGAAQATFATVDRAGDRGRRPRVPERVVGRQRTPIRT